MSINREDVLNMVKSLRKGYPKMRLIDFKDLCLESGVTSEEWNVVVDELHNHLDRGKTFMKSSNWDDAIEELEVSYALDPTMPEVLFCLAEAHTERWVKKRNSKDKAEGIRFAEECLEYDPQNTKAARIITNLKSAPVEYWIKPALAWKLARYAVFFILIGVGYWYVRKNYESLTAWASQAFSSARKTASGYLKDKNNVLENIHFESGQAQLAESSKRELDKLVAYLKENKDIKGEIGGHTDNVGFADGNQQISELRAKAIYDYLVAQGIQTYRLSYKGYGDKRPAHPNDSELNRAKNRRVEFTIK